MAYVPLGCRALFRFNSGRPRLPAPWWQEDDGGAGPRGRIRRRLPAHAQDGVARSV